jgi:uncharacterized membrane protein (UPF0127 family)
MGLESGGRLAGLVPRLWLMGPAGLSFHGLVEVCKTVFSRSSLWLVAIALLLVSCGDDRYVVVDVGGVEARVEVAATSDARRQGLMGRNALDEDHGMLLVFPREKVLKIWMLNTPLPLDVGFFDRHGVLINALSMEPDGGAVVHHSDAPALFALEMNRGWFARNDIGKGAKLNLPHTIVGRD